MWMYKYDHQRKKLDDRARLTSFVEYSDGHSDNTYIGYDEQKRKEYTSLHVAFDPQLPVVNENTNESELLWRLQKSDKFDADDEDGDDGYDTGGTTATRSDFSGDDNLDDSMASDNASVHTTNT